MLHNDNSVCLTKFAAFVTFVADFYIECKITTTHSNRKVKLMKRCDVHLFTPSPGIGMCNFFSWNTETKYACVGVSCRMYLNASMVTRDR